MYTVQPKEDHQQTIILLHGRGDTAQTFAMWLLSTNLPDGSTLINTFPHAKFVFLQAPLRALAAHPDIKYHQWFDVWNLQPGSEEDDLQIPDLRETVNVVHAALREEIELVGAENVVLGGLSQGCASSLISMILWDGKPLAGLVGMSGWLPFRKVLEGAVPAPADKDGHVPKDEELGNEAVKVLAKKIGYADSYSTTLAFQKTPVFLGHGLDDHVVQTRLGKEAATCFKSLKAKVTYKDYKDLAHWYSPEMLEDIVIFLVDETGWKNGSNW